MRRIIVLNQKGGVGKTTTAANLGTCLAEQGRTVLLVDADPQANLSLHFGLDLQRGDPSLYTLLRNEHRLPQVVRRTCVRRVGLIPTTVDLAGFEVEMSQDPRRFLAMREALRQAPSFFDYVIIDSPPSLGLITLNAMCAAKEVFIPLQTEFFALQGLGKLLGTVRRVRGVNSALQVTGVIACMHDRRTCLAQEILDEIRRHFGARVFQTVVRKNVRLAEAPGFGRPITQYDPECHGSEDYRALAQEVMAMEATLTEPRRRVALSSQPDGEQSGRMAG
jgi:chromosome partitioning protein